MQIIENIPKLKPRSLDSHKGDFGSVCIIAGSQTMAGAAAITAKAAFRSGAGLVKVAAIKDIIPTVTAIEPSITTIGLIQDKNGMISNDSIADILNAAKNNDITASGPGLGQSAELKTIIEALTKIEGLRLIVDADGLNNLAAVKNWYQKSKANMIITPHPGEAKRLWTGLFREKMPSDRQQQAIMIAEKTNTVTVLKGAGTIVTDGKKLYINTTGNPGMAVAGSGDVLTGIISALAGQGMNNFDAAVTGVYIHGLAADIAVKKTGQISLTAIDIIDTLASAFLKN